MAGKVLKIGRKIARRDGKVLLDTNGDDCCCGGEPTEYGCADCASCPDTFVLSWTGVQVTYVFDCGACVGDPGGTHNTVTIVYHVSIVTTIRRTACNPPCGDIDGGFCCWETDITEATDTEVAHEVEIIQPANCGPSTTYECVADGTDCCTGGGTPGVHPSATITCESCEIDPGHLVLFVDPGHPKLGAPVDGCDDVWLFRNLRPGLSLVFTNLGPCPDDWDSAALLAAATIVTGDSWSVFSGACSLTSVTVDNPGTLTIS